MAERKGWKDHRHRLHQALSAPGISNGEAMTLFCLVDLLDWKEQSPEPLVQVRKSKLSMDRFRKNTNASRKNIQRDIRGLTAAGYVTVIEETRDNGSDAANTYQLHLKRFIEDPT